MTFDNKNLLSVDKWHFKLTDQEARKYVFLLRKNINIIGRTYHIVIIEGCRTRCEIFSIYLVTHCEEL